ncbi:fatty acid-binding protein DegV [Fervidicella metallireducens AeB]|uniref:Fatty acid-binding protein DegV n=1 Tax=Fervidicella metallireducens AeB TaxID=1403537 RepID=A0A017RVD1_9CLOT|nr:DegV family protein [Fervidicella metallireducens]EYE87870.1 fatty acid-binding protein DegV [Fervidicella metallireducens AeB]
MEKIKILTDSACDLDLDYLRELEVELIPLKVSFDQEEYEDRVTITTKEFYEKMKTFPGVPKTAQATPVIFEEKFKKLIAEGYHVIAICFSSRLSGTYQSACVAKEMIGTDKVDVIDSKAASVGFGLIVREAALMVKEGKTRQEIIDRVIYMRDRMEHIFAVGSLEMLKKGGRISTAQAVVGSILNVKPILQFDDGYIIPYDKVRGEKSVIKKMIETMRERGHEIEKQVIGLNFAGSTELCMALKEEIQKTFNVKEFVVSEIGAAIGSHAGPGTVSVFFMRK